MLQRREEKGGFREGILRVSPDILPPESIKIGAVWRVASPMGGTRTIRWHC
jgi:hypothetical protein